jgi:hypothetical protein
VSNACILTEEESDQDDVDFDSVFESYDNGPPFKFKNEVVDECYKKSSSKVNLAVQLVRTAYSKAERANSNCSGDHRYGKRKLSPSRMNAIKAAIYSIYPVRPGEKEELIWKAYRVAIDSSCRSLNRPKKKSKGRYLF